MSCRSTTDNCNTGEWHTAYLTKVSSSHPQVLGICLQWGSNKCHFNLVELLPWREDLNILIKMQQGNKESRKYIHKYIYIYVYVDIPANHQFFSGRLIMIWKTHRISIFLKPFFGAQWLLPFFDVCRTSTGLRMPRAAVGETQFSWFNGNKTDTKLKAGLVSVVSCRKVWGHLPIAPLMSTRSTPPN